MESFLSPSFLVIPIERRFVHKYYPHPFRVLSVFGALGKMELITGFGKLEKTKFSITLLEQEVWWA